MVERFRSASSRVGRRVDAIDWAKTIPELFGLGLAGTVLIAATGVTGAVIGAALVLVWLRLPIEYTFVLGHIALVVFATGRLSLTLLIAVEASLGLLLVGSLLRAAGSPISGIVWLLTFLALGGGVLIAVDSGIVLWQIAVVSWLVATAAVYGLYRHQLITLGLADTDGGHYS